MLMENKMIWMHLMSPYRQGPKTTNHQLYYQNSGLFLRIYNILNISIFSLLRHYGFSFSHNITPFPQLHNFLITCKWSVKVFVYSFKYFSFQVLAEVEDRQDDPDAPDGSLNVRECMLYIQYMFVYAWVYIEKKN